MRIVNLYVRKLVDNRLFYHYSKRRRETQLKAKLTLRGVAFSAFFAALLVVLSFYRISLGFTPVPITLQTFAVMLAGGLLGARYGLFSMLLVVVLTALGFPLLNGKGGIPYLQGATGGYIVIWPVCAFLIGWFVQRVKRNDAAGFAAIVAIMAVFGSLLVYVTGVPWLAHVAKYSFSKALTEGFYPYLIGDAIKVVAAALITIAVRQVFPVERLTGGSGHAVRREADPASRA